MEGEMSWLLFMDESGHDHKNTPLEVRGGIALHAKDIWVVLSGSSLKHEQLGLD